MGMKKYQIIYADPPWDYGPPRNIIRKDGKRSSFGYGAAGHYPTMKTEDICKLPVKELADKDCGLFIWTTSHHLFETEKVIKAWGFQYCTLGFVWIKYNMNTQTIKKGMGYYTRANPELCLFAKKGRMADKVVRKDISSVVMYPIEEHSKKPQ